MSPDMDVKYSPEVNPAEPYSEGPDKNFEHLDPGEGVTIVNTCVVC